MTATDIAIILGAVGILTTSIAGAVKTLRQVDAIKGQVEETKATLREDVQAVHEIVNQQHTDLVTYQDSLIKALQRAGVHVPKDESIDNAS